MAYPIARNLLFDNEPCNVHPFTTMDNDCSPEGIAAVALGSGFVIEASELEPYLTNKAGEPLALSTPFAVIEAITPRKTRPPASA